MTPIPGAWYLKINVFWVGTLLLDPDLMKKTAVFGQVSGELLGAVGGGYWLGKWLDGKFHLSPWCAASLASLGFIYGVWRIRQLSSAWLQGASKEK